MLSCSKQSTAGQYQPVEVNVIGQGVGRRKSRVARMRSLDGYILILIATIIATLGLSAATVGIALGLIPVGEDADRAAERSDPACGNRRSDTRLPRFNSSVVPIHEALDSYQDIWRSIPDLAVANLLSDQGLDLEKIRAVAGMVDDMKGKRISKVAVDDIELAEGSARKVGPLTVKGSITMSGQGDCALEKQAVRFELKLTQEKTMTAGR